MSRVAKRIVGSGVNDAILAARHAGPKAARVQELAPPTSHKRYSPTRWPVSRPEHSSFDTTLRFELASEEARPLFVSYVFASVLALAWLALVHTMPRPIPPILVDHGRPIIIFFDFLPERPAEPPIQARERAGGRGVRRIPTPAGSPGAGSMGDAFAGSAGLVDAGQLLRGVEVAPSG